MVCFLIMTRFSVILPLKKFNKETMFEYGWYGDKNFSADVRTGYTNGIPTTGTSDVFGKGGSQMMAMPTFYFEFEEGDQRRDVSICNYALVLGKTDKYRMNTYAGMGVGKYRINWKSNLGSDASHRDINWPMLRYADVLLMYAEALNELNDGANADAVNAVKEVRMRAFRNDETKVGVIPTAYQEFKDFIIQERKLELSNEGLRRTDLPRWGIQYEKLIAEKDKLAQLCNREGKYADVAPYWAFKITSAPKFSDPTIGLEHINVTEDDLDIIGLSDDDKATLHIMNKGDKGEVKCKLYEGNDGKVYLNASLVPSGVAASEVEYTLLNMYSINTSSQKGNLSTKAVEGIADKNNWIVGATGIYYGLTKNMTELMPFNQTSIIDVNPGLAGQQHPGYN